MRRLAWLAAFALVAHAAGAATLEVVVSGVRNDRGSIRVSVCERTQFLTESCPYRGSTPAQSGAVTVRVPGVPPGVFAAQAFHDETDSGHIARGLFGMPTEGFGFSRDARVAFGPPKFDDAAFSVDAAGADPGVGVPLHYPN